MKILIVGATGTLGRAVVKELEVDHEIIQAGLADGQYRVDISDDASVHTLFDTTGPFDAIICTAGEAHVGPLKKMTPQEFNKGLQNKLLGQVRLYLIGQHHLNAGGSVTLTTGIIADEPLRDCANITSVDAGIEGFVRAAAAERGDVRINAVSPTVLTESLDIYAPYCPGFESVPAAKVALAYRRSVEGIQTGRIYRVW
ncbi:short chain dehydrogenase [Pandoraea pulmonicola]|uniref:Short chain dehydrogenase n=1 Tax=Pandoraea pulmonicola TaxID=93221 RepID=A0AAJ5D2U9_PANPU|nr:short chain dehydrogenase [Pandoraea pulmonicola]AJC22564.1 short chain dehydrogenase [Pandoraea pulmonicola]SUA93248.1 short chain dehydrogenase [Pandoraea pulmonicola]